MQKLMPLVCDWISSFHAVYWHPFVLTLSQCSMQHCCYLLLLSAGEMLLLKTGLLLKFVPACLDIRSVVLQVPANFSSFSVFIVYSLHGINQKAGAVIDLYI